MGVTLACRFVAPQPKAGFTSCCGAIWLELGSVDIATILGKATQHLLNSLVERVKLIDEIVMTPLQAIDNYTTLHVVHRTPVA